MGTKVFKGNHQDWGMVAVKVMIQNSVAMEHTAEKEHQLLLDLAKATGRGADNVIKYRSLERDAKHIYISM